MQHPLSLARSAGPCAGLFLALSGGCVGDEEHPFSGSSGLQEEEAGLAGACEAEAEGTWEAEGDVEGRWFTHLEAEQSEAIGTVFAVAWASAEAGHVRALSRLADGRVRTSPWSADHLLEGQLELRGLPALSTAEVRLCLETDGGEVVLSEVFEVTTGGPPSILPVFEATPGTAAPVEGFQLITTVTDGGEGSQSAVMIVDTAGEVVWWWPIQGMTTDSAAALSADGEWVWLMNDGTLSRVRFDGSEVEVFTETLILGAHHHFELLPDGTVAFLGSVGVTGPEGQAARSHTLNLLDPEGSIETLWSYADSVDEILPYDVWDELVGEGDAVLGNLNHIAYDASSRTFLMSLQTEGCVLSVGRDSGELEGWVCPLDEGAGGHFEGSSRWVATHGIDLTDEGFFLFVNETDGDSCAAVVEVSADSGLDEVSEVWVDAGADCHHNPVLGDVQGVGEDTVVVTWSTSAEVEQLSLDGERRLLLSGSFGQAFGYGAFLPGLYGRI